MPRVRLTRNSFNSGELDPLLSARFDVRAHNQGAAALRNVVCLPQGGVKRRGGLTYVGTISDGDAKLVPFSFNITQTYLLVFGNQKMYVYKDGVLQTNINGSGNDYLVVPWTLAEVANIGWTQSADTLIVCHHDYAPRKITRTGHTTWSIAAVTFSIQPSEDFNADYDSNTFTPSHTSGSGRTLTCSASKFTAEHVGGRFEGNDGIAEITAFGSGTSVTIDILKDFKNTNAINGKRAWLAEPVWSSEWGYPRVVTFHEGRLWFANTTKQPQTLWGSVTNDFFNFDFGTGLDDEAIAVTLDTDQVNEIRHLISLRHLQVLTSGGEFYMPASPIKPSEAGVKRQTRYGAADVQPAVLDGSCLFIQRTGQVVREFVYSFVEDAYTSNSASLLASHLVSSPVDMAVQRGSISQDANYVFMVNGDGNVSVYNTLREQEIAAWSNWETNGNFKRVAVVEDIVYFLVERSGTYLLCKIDELTYTDQNVVYSALGSDTATGLAHLNGSVVRVIADGSILGNETVSGGQITMDRSATDAEVGLNFDTLIRTLPVNVDYQDGPTFMQLKRFPSVFVDVYESLGVFVDGFRIADRNFGAGILGQAPQPWSGVERVRLLGWDRLKTIEITQTDPQPLTLRAVTLEAET